MFDRHLRPIPMPTPQGVRRRVEDLVGITAFKMRKHRPNWSAIIFDIVNVFWRRMLYRVSSPYIAEQQSLVAQAVLPGIFLLAVFGFGIGINVTNAVFVGSPPR